MSDDKMAFNNKEHISEDPAKVRISYGNPLVTTPQIFACGRIVEMDITERVPGGHFCGRRPRCRLCKMQRPCKKISLNNDVY